MSGIKKLAGQTIWYGASTIAARFINLLLTPFLTYSLANTSDYGKMGLIYAAMPVLNVIFTYGFETAYFRFATKPEYKNSIYSTAVLSIFFSTFFFTAILWFYQDVYASIVSLQGFPQIVQLSIFIVALDALNRIPFARLRDEGRPKKFAFINILSIVVNVFFTWFFIAWCPEELKKNADSWVSYFYDANTNPIVYVLIANLIQSIVTLILLSGESAKVRFQFNIKLWKEMMIYSLPLIIVGMGGMINETFDRLMLAWWLPGSESFGQGQVGIYNACYKLSILITLFIQAFRFGAEPFFFKQADGQNPQKVYARVMKFFVIIISVMFLSVSLFIPIWKNFIGPKYWVGLSVVPILLLANMFLGIYYNLSIWYKLSHKTMSGAWITIIGVLITCIINYLFIPRFSYMACAWATFTCYGTMMVISYLWGQKEYRIPYATKKLTAYIVIAVLLYFIHYGITHLLEGFLVSFISGLILLMFYILFVSKIEAKEFVKLPLIGKYFSRFIS